MKRFALGLMIGWMVVHAIKGEWSYSFAWFASWQMWWAVVLHLGLGQTPACRSKSE